MTTAGEQQITCVVGAGSTVQVSEEIQNGLQVPTDRDFFKSAQAVLNKETALSTGIFTNLLTGLQEMFPSSLTIPDYSHLPGLEEVMTILDLRTQDHPESGLEYRKRYEALLSLIVLTFWRSLTREGKEVPSSRHDTLTRYLKEAPKSNVISFNYDYVMDTALINAGVFDLFGYGVNFDWQFDDAFERISVSAPVDPYRLRFFKLHGSMTWWRCMECNALVYIAHADSFESVLRSRLGLETGKFQCPNCRTESFSPFLIPPLLSKNYDETEWKYIWKNSGSVLRETDKLVVWGYSLPPTDFYAEYLFRNALAQRARPIGDLVVINPHEEIFEKFKALFRPIKAEMYASIDEFFEKEEIL